MNVDRTGQVWERYNHEIYVFVCRSDGPQGVMAPYNDWVVVNLLTTFRLQKLRLRRDELLESLHHWKGIA